MRRLGGLCLAFFVVIGARLLAPGAVPAADATLALGFVLIVSFLIGQAVTAWGVPAISGYILSGVLFGPYLLKAWAPELAVLGKETVASLQILDDVALGLIALTAGGELKAATVRRRAKSIFGVTLCHLVLVFAGVCGALLWARSWFPLFEPLSAGPLAAAVMLFGVTALANSPATTIAVIQETGARGPVTDLALAVTVAKDLVVVAAFTIVLAISERLVQGASQAGAHVWLLLLWEVSGSLLLGVGLGWLLALYLKYVRRELPLAVLGAALLSVAVAERIHVSGLMLCLVAGFYVENFSEHGEALIRAIERHALTVYVVFFTIAGAGLDLDALRATWPLALSLAAARLILTALATYVGARAAGDEPAVRRYTWTGFLGQAGVTLGFAVIIAKRFPEFGEAITTVIVAVIGLNQILGPVIFRLGLYWAGEVPRADEPPEKR